MKSENQLMQNSIRMCLEFTPPKVLSSFSYIKIFIYSKSNIIIVVAQDDQNHKVSHKKSITSVSSSNKDHSSCLVCKTATQKFTREEIKITNDHYIFGVIIKGDHFNLISLKFTINTLHWVSQQQRLTAQLPIIYGSHYKLFLSMTTQQFNDLNNKNIMLVQRVYNAKNIRLII